MRANNCDAMKIRLNRTKMLDIKIFIGTSFNWRVVTSNRSASNYYSVIHLYSNGFLIPGEMYID